MSHFLKFDSNFDFLFMQSLLIYVFKTFLSLYVAIRAPRNVAGIVVVCSTSEKKLEITKPATKTNTHEIKLSNFPRVHNESKKSCGASVKKYSDTARHNGSIKM